MQGTKRRTGPKRSPCHCLIFLSLSGRPLTLGPSQPLTVAGAQTRARDAESRSPPRVPNGGCGEERHGRSAGSGQGGTSVRNPGRKRPALRSEARRFPSAWPAWFLIPSDADRTGCSPERAPGHEARGARRLPAWASLFRLPLPRGARAQPALAAAFSRPGLSRLSLSPSPFALLSSFLAFSLCRALPSPLFLQALLDCARVPGSSWPPRFEAETSQTPKTSLTGSCRLSFRRIGALPREMGGEREFRGSRGQPAPRPWPEPEVCFPQHLRARAPADRAPRRGHTPVKAPPKASSNSLARLPPASLLLPLLPERPLASR